MVVWHSLSTIIVDFFCLCSGIWGKNRQPQQPEIPSLSNFFSRLPFLEIYFLQTLCTGFSHHTWSLAFCQPQPFFRATSSTFAFFYIHLPFNKQLPGFWETKNLDCNSHWNFFYFTKSKQGSPRPRGLRIWLSLSVGRLICVDKIF